MKPAAFEYEAPRSLDEALALLARHGDEAKVLAGGQSLIATMNFRLAQPAMLVDINGITELSYIREASGGLEIGALTRQATVEKSELVASRCALLAEAMPHVAHSQIRNRGTFGGSLAHADSASELPAVALALEAEMVICSESGERTVPAEEFFVGLFETALEPEELLVEVRLPDLPQHTGTAFLELSRRRGDFALVGVAVVLEATPDGTVARSRIVLHSVGETPVLAQAAMTALRGKVPDETNCRNAAEAAADNDIDPLGDLHASAEYRRHLTSVLTRRALLAAASRIQN